MGKMICSRSGDKANARFQLPPWKSFVSGCGCHPCCFFTCHAPVVLVCQSLVKSARVLKFIYTGVPSEVFWSLARPGDQSKQSE
ncbi:Root hair defective 3 GTP-binding protein [Prunus dulcis]|uniref:Root hair defective 3 GTP-binding protein n=1 Tax=Prunus dulcis TaxID=3755 RepID=A0A5H2Y8S5_PRUDU|nr:Root hair defective 3 GTP-binding protein [Prunus dulcis]